MADRIGQQLGNYRLIRSLGQGGFAEVYLGEHIYLQTQAAIKVLQMRLASEDREDFLKEARTIAGLKHPHIIRVLDFGIDAGTPFLVMDYAPHGTLLKRHPKGVPLPLPSIMDYVKQIAPALQYAHERKLVHRDVKPENLLLDENNEVLLSDFGIALVTQSSRYQSMQEVLGTAAYMAPEQLEGKPRPASDQYALGIIVYEWLCGDRPFHGTFTELYSQHLFVPPPSLHEKVPTIPPAAEQVVLRALEKDPHRRFASVQAFAVALEQACQPTSVQVSAEAPDQPFEPLLSSHLTSSQPIPLTALPTPSAQVPTLPSPQNVTNTQPSKGEFAQAEHPELLTPTSETNRIPLPTLPTPQSTTPAPSLRPVSQHRGFSSYKAALLVLLAFLIVGSAGLIYNTVSTSNAHLQAMATATAAAKAYDTFVDTNGIMSGFDAAHTHFNPFEQILNPANVSTLTPAWSYPAVGVVATSPAVVNGVVYFGSRDKSLYALDARSGSILWNFQTKGAVTSSPAVVNGVVYFGSDDHSLYAVDARTGTKLWSFVTGDYIASSPMVTNDVVYVGSYDHSLYAVDARTGTKLWSFATGINVLSVPAVANGLVYVVLWDDSLYALDARTGTKLWSSTINIDSSPAVVNGVVYTVSGKLDALDARTGTKLWSFAATSASDGLGSSPAVANGVVYVGSANGKLYAVDARTGTKLWSFAADITSDNSITSSPVVNGVVYVRSWDDSLYALDARTGTRLWSFGSGHTIIWGNSIFSSPAVINGVVYVGSFDAKMYALDARTGTKLWSLATGNPIVSSPAVVNGVIYIGSYDGLLYALDARTGTKLWSFATGNGITSSPAVVNGVVYVGSGDGRLYAFHLPGT